MDKTFQKMGPFQRATEAIRFFLARLERWLSSGGVLREWIRLNLLVAAICGTGVIFGVPVVTSLLIGFADWTELLALTVSNLVGMAVSLPPLVLVIAGGILLWRFGKRRWRRRRPSQPAYHDEDSEYYR